MFISCKTAQSNIYNNRTGIDAARESSAAAGAYTAAAKEDNQRITSGIENSVNLIRELENQIDGNASPITAIKTIIDRIRERNSGGNKQNNGEAMGAAEQNETPKPND